MKDYVRKSCWRASSARVLYGSRGEEIVAGAAWTGCVGSVAGARGVARSVLSMGKTSLRLVRVKVAGEIMCVPGGRGWRCLVGACGVMGKTG